MQPGLRMTRRNVAAHQPKVEVRFLGGECLWSWDLVDRKTGVVIESGWQERWLAYESADEAQAAGAAHRSARQAIVSP